ncbi:hypothetical protein Poli38472_002512 [Pythium oligandrum]|uniref:Uncharacterized protein n=1 Tax=Pythium oligandrum TaxID=41045 RepID=A0A8K1FI93_PYTOL|nr:hypothetical protein Poli38472_002512 [Pythium oligandrum]|eukprot:TMW63571.1 hypothetical protein Poli38472_002512 [Pythium oligandrum]
MNANVVEFSQWMDDLRLHKQQRPTQIADSPLSATSSWADTDSDSDSDSEIDAGSYMYMAGKKSRMMTTRKAALKHTAPIMIPEKTQRHQPRSSMFYEEYESMLQRRQQRRIEQLTPECESEVDEDDPLFYGNLAFIRSQNTQSSLMASRRSLILSQTTQDASAEDNEQIFDMEL